VKQMRALLAYATDAAEAAFALGSEGIYPPELLQPPKPLAVECLRSSSPARRRCAGNRVLEESPDSVGQGAG
jgi:hypothetical protein